MGEHPPSDDDGAVIARPSYAQLTELGNTYGMLILQKYLIFGRAIAEIEAWSEQAVAEVRGLLARSGHTVDDIEAGCSLVRSTILTEGKRLSDVLLASSGGGNDG